MRAVVFDEHLRYSRDYPAPRPGRGESLVRVTYAGICATDLEILKGYMGFKGVVGHEFTGVVQESPTPALAGKRVVGEINIGCGECALCAKGLRNHCRNRKVLGILGHDGAFADYLILPEENLHVLPDNVTDEEAVLVEPLAAAFEVTRQVRMGPGIEVCVLGDGRLGLLTALAINLTGAEVVAIGRHREKLDIVKRAGIRTNLGREGVAAGFDVVVDATGSPTGLREALELVRPLGTIVLKTTVADRNGVDLNRVVIDEVTLVGSRCGPFAPAIKAIEEGRVDVRPLITRTFRMEDALEAFDYVANKGKEEGALKVILKIT